MRIEIINRRIRITLTPSNVDSNRRELEEAFIENVLGLRKAGEGVMLRRMDHGGMDSLYALETAAPSSKPEPISLTCPPGVAPVNIVNCTTADVTGGGE